MKRIDDRQAARSCSRYYIPHHAVLKNNSLTTKLRVVFDASCKTSTGVSLNECLLVGPTLQQDLFSILLRFRTFPYAITADITQMYRQVRIDKAQTSLQTILWRNHPSEEISTFELQTVTYGTACASFLAIRAMQELAYLNASTYPVGSTTIINDFYVDDLLSGANTETRIEKQEYFGMRSSVYCSREDFILGSGHPIVLNSYKTYRTLTPVSPSILLTRNRKYTHWGCVGMRPTTSSSMILTSQTMAR